MPEARRDAIARIAEQYGVVIIEDDAYGMLLCGDLNDPATGYEYGKLAVAMNDRFNDVALKASLRPGSRFGLTNVLLQAVEPPRYRLDLLANNEGERSTGRLQGGIYGLMYGPLRRGDRLILRGS